MGTKPLLERRVQRHLHPRCHLRALAHPPICRLLRFSVLSARTHRALLCSACCYARARPPPSSPGGPPPSLCPPARLLALRAAAGSSAKDVGAALLSCGIDCGMDAPRCTPSIFLRGVSTLSCSLRE
ncbi:hypothetical protein LUU34_01591100 [Aix galericulata]|nr:hypothetical protein LUU34_01591100 [Aix galericulata]